jgi:ketol-acid reductoisomerase
VATLYYDRDANQSVVRAHRIAVIGYGNQGHAHAQNLRDSGCEVQVGLRPDGESWNRARRDGFLVQTVEEASRWGDLISVLIPDQFHGEVFQATIGPHLEPGKSLLFAHGFSIHYGFVVPPAQVDVAMVAPVGPGHMMRRLYVEGLGEPALLAVHQDISGRAESLALSYAAAIGCTRAGVVRTTFAEETEANLFGEQAVLCGGVSHLIKAGFDTLVEAGYAPEVAYFECVQTVKLIVDLIYEGGLAQMHARISDTAEYGDYVSGPVVVDQHVRDSMQRVLQHVQDGSFARRWVAEYEAGMPEMRRLRAEERSELIEQVGARLRSMMPWLSEPQAEEDAPVASPAQVVKP